MTPGTYTIAIHTVLCVFDRNERVSALRDLTPGTAVTVTGGTNRALVEVGSTKGIIYELSALVEPTEYARRALVS